MKPLRGPDSMPLSVFVRTSSPRTSSRRKAREKAARPDGDLSMPLRNHFKGTQRRCQGENPLWLSAHVV
jgi:hypothetical protein